MAQDQPNERIRHLEKEVSKLREQLSKAKGKQSFRNKSKRYLFSKKAAFMIIGKGLKTSLFRLYGELPDKVSKDTFADVSAHLIWRITRIGIFGVLIAAIPLLVLFVQTLILSKQNSLFKTQNDLFSLQLQQVEQQNKLIKGQNQLFQEQNKLFQKQNTKVDVQNDLVSNQNAMLNNQNGLFQNQNQLVEQQNNRIVQQTELIEADRRSSLVFLMSNIMDKVDEEIKNKENSQRSLSFELIGRITALSQSLKPYKYLKNDRLIRKPLSPERGQLLLALVNTRLDTTNTYDLIFENTKFSRSDLQEARLSHAYLVGARLNNANMEEVLLKEANLQGAKLQSADLQEANLKGANLQKATLRKANLNLADLEKADLSGANLNEADLSHAKLKKAILHKTNFKDCDLSFADLSETDLSNAMLNRANLENAMLKNAKVNAEDWFQILKAWKVKGLEELEEKYKLVATDKKDKKGNTDYKIKER